MVVVQHRNGVFWLALVGVALWPRWSSAQAEPAPAGPPAEQQVGQPADQPADQPAVASELPAEPTVETPAEVPAAGDADDIVVTGSRIKRSSSFDAPSPVDVVDRKEMAKSGASTMKDLIANMPANFGGQNNAGLGTGTGVRGAALFDLHGLGPSTTLVLVNGRRLLRTGLTIEGQQFDNAAQIPMSFVDRIEIMKGGGSAIYGSDAVSGVVNIITRRKYDGLEVQLGGNIATQPGGLRDGEASLTLGTASDKGAIAVNVTYYERTELRATDRPYSLGDPSKASWDFTMPVPAGPMFPEGYKTPTLSSGAGNPGNFALTPLPQTTPPTPALRPDPMCTSAPNSYLRGGRCSFLFTPYYHYVYPESRLNVYSTMEYDVGDDVTGFAEIGYMRLDIENTISPSYVLNEEILIPLDHPQIPAEWRPDIDQAVASATAMSQQNPDLPPVTAKLRFAPPGSRTRGGDYQPMMLSTHSEGIRVVLGMRGDFSNLAAGSFFEDWDWELSATYQGNGFLESQPDDITENLQRSINACTPTITVPDVNGANVTIPNPDYGAIPCFSPFYSQANVSANLNDRNNSSGASATEYIMGQAVGRTTNSMWVGDAFLRGPLLRLPGGPLSLAVGAQGRRESLIYRSDYDSNRGNYASIGGTPNYQGSRNILAAYAELSAPVIDGLELQAAVRYEYYQDIDEGSLDPKFGVSWAPFKSSAAAALSGIRVRGGYATSFRGPSLFQTYGRLVALQEFMESSGSTFRPVSTQGNPNLQPEQSVAINGGLEWALGGLHLEADYWRFSYEDIIVKENSIATWNRCRAVVDAGMPGTGDPACRGVTLVGSSLASIDLPFVNAASSNTQGIDFAGSFRFGDADGAGIFSLAANASYLISYKLRDTDQSPEREVAGFRNSDNFAPSLPRLRMTIPVGWALAGHSISATGIFVGAYTDDYRMVNGVRVVGPGIDPWLTFNLQYSYRMEKVFGEATTFTLGAVNVLDSDPPFVQTTLGYDITVHDPRGRMLFARLGQEF